MIRFLCLLLVIIPFVMTAMPVMAQPMADDEASVYVLDVPRLEVDIEIDGILDEAVWAEAAVAESFSQYLPADGKPAEDATIVLVWYNPTSIHFGIKAFAPEGRVRATLADRDKIEGDDYVQILLDTFNDERQAFVFGVNPLGVQSDGILSDAARESGMISSGSARAYQIDISPDFVYESKGRLTDEGFEVEIQIPFKSLRYQTSETQNWGFNVIRQVQYSGYENTWSPVLQSHASFLAQSGMLSGLTDLRRGLVLDLTPETTYSVLGAPDGPDWTYSGQDVALGGNVRWGITNNLTLSSTVNPDFSQVEADVAQIQWDPRMDVFIPEKRPFFLDGIELFSSPNQLIYTRRVVQPAGAVKLTGKIDNTNIALLTSADKRESSFSGNVRYFNAARIRRDLQGQSTLGLVYTDKVDGDAFNRVIAADGKLVFKELYSLTFQGAGSITNTGAENISGPLWDVRLDRAGREWGFQSGIKGISPDFQAQSGFISRTGIVTASFQPRITRFGEEGAKIESWTNSLTFSSIWDYDKFTGGDAPDDLRFHVNTQLVLRGGWVVGSSFLLESFKYPPELYANYFIERQENGVPVDTVAYVGTDRITNIDLTLLVGTPRFQKFNAGLFVIAGRDTDFFEWAESNIFFVFWNAQWRPTQQLRVDFLYNHQQYIRPDDWSSTFRRSIPRVKIEYQLTRALFLRLVAQYDSQVQTTLRDQSRTDDPILFRDPGTGFYSRATGWERNRLRFDWLVSYRPTPGTVVFAGYGRSSDDPRSFRFRALDRLDDGFFFKLSYLFRV